METHIVVPLVQNVAGGIAAIILTYILFLIAGRISTTPVDHNNATFWSAIVGTIITTLATLLRFFSDDIGLLTTAYSAGAASRQDEINRLTSENAALRTVVEGTQRPAAANAANDDRLQRSYRHATVMLENGIRGRPIDRRTCKNQLNIGEVDFGRAYRLLQESGVRNQDDTFTIAKVSEAKRKLTEYYNYHFKIAASNQSYNPPWL